MRSGSCPAGSMPAPAPPTPAGRGTPAAAKAAAIDVEAPLAGLGAAAGAPRRLAAAPRRVRRPSPPCFKAVAPPPAGGRGPAGAAGPSAGPARPPLVRPGVPPGVVAAHEDGGAGGDALAAPPRRGRRLDHSPAPRGRGDVAEPRRRLPGPAEE